MNVEENYEYENETHHHPAMEGDAEEQVEHRQHNERPEALQQQRHQPHLEHVGVKQHQQEDELVEEQADVLNARRVEHNEVKKTILKVMLIMIG